MGRRILLFFLTLSLWACAVEASAAQAGFFGETKVGFFPLESDRYGASYYVPPDYKADQKWPLVVVLYSDEARSGEEVVKSWVTEIEKRGLVGLFVSYLEPREQPLGSDERLIRLIREIQLRYTIDRGRILLTGFGDAAHYAFYLGMRYPDRFSAVGLIGGGAIGRFEPFLKSPDRAAKKIPFFIAFGGQDGTLDRESFVQAHARFHVNGFPVEMEEFENVGHDPHPDLHARILDWFSELPAPSQDAAGVRWSGLAGFLSRLFHGLTH
jgi:poly(3-hydroxybutyrate) depolymerase